MTIKEVMAIAQDDNLLWMLNKISEDIKNGVSRTECEEERAAKQRKEYAKKIVNGLKEK